MLVQSFYRAMLAEPVKYRRSITRRLAFGVPLLFIGLALLYVGVAWLRSLGIDDNGGLINVPGETPWEAVARLFDQAWLLVVVPFGLPILGTLATQAMHSSRMWTPMLTQPVTRSGLYLAQVAGLMLVVLGGMLTVGLGYLLIGLLFGFGPVDWQVVLARPLLSWAAGFCALALQVWVGTRFRGFALPIVIGIGGAVGSMILLALGAWFLAPWIYPSLVHDSPLPVLGLSLAGGLLFTLIGMFEFSRMEVNSE